jgi:hypothetical protein
MAREHKGDKENRMEIRKAKISLKTKKNLKQIQNSSSSSKDDVPVPPSPDSLYNL